MKSKDMTSNGMSKGLTISAIVEAENANYGEGFGNVKVLKKMTRGDGNTYTYISRQALGYNYVEQMGIGNTPVILSGKETENSSAVIQFDPISTIKDYPEIDLFGYMKTVSSTKKAKKGKSGEDEKISDEKKEKTKTRSAVVRLSNAIALEPYNGEMDFLTNAGLAKRIDHANNIGISEIHRSYYAYTMAIDLDRVGVDENDNINLDKDEKAKRIIKVLEAMKCLYRNIKGAPINLSPLFVVGGLYEVKCPFFENRLKVAKNALNVDAVQSNIEMAGANSKVGYMKGTFNNEAEISKLNPMTIPAFFEALMKEVEEYYG